MNREPLDAIFAPSSIAVLGASNSPGKVGHDIFYNILEGEYEGELYPINPGSDEIQGVKAYKKITDVPGDVDLAIMALPAKFVEDSVDQALEKGVKGIVIITAGFREVGEEGLAAEMRIVEKARAAGVRIVGPNCLGVINPHKGVQMNASFAKRMPLRGNISFISQSGALCASILDFATDRGIGFSKFISIGNKADVEELDLIRYLHKDPETEVIMIYTEELRHGPEFVEEVKQITSGENHTPIVVIKSGRTSEGAKAAASHTGSLAGSEAVYDALFKQAGVIRAETINDLFDYVVGFAVKTNKPAEKGELKLPKGNRVAIVTNAGGPGIIATDMSIASGLELAKFSEKTTQALLDVLPGAASASNPVDVLGDATKERYEATLQTVVDDENVDGVIVILTPQSMTDSLGSAEAVEHVAVKTDKPILTSFVGVDDVAEGYEYLQKHNIPVYEYPESACKAMGALADYSKMLSHEPLEPFKNEYDKEAARAIIKEALDSGMTRLGEIEGVKILDAYGFPVLPTELSTSADEAAALASEMGYPVAMKIVSEDILHKSDADAVRIKISSDDEAREAYDTIMKNSLAYKPDANIRGVLVQKMAQPGEEFILGMDRYPNFGPLIMVGTGGVAVEVFKDVAFGLAPIQHDEAADMINSVKGVKLLQGFRNAPEGDVEEMTRLLVALSDLVSDNPEIEEMDINPLFVHEKGQGATVADVRLVLSDPRDK